MSYRRINEEFSKLASIINQDVFLRENLDSLYYFSCAYICYCDEKDYSKDLVDDEFKPFYYASGIESDYITSISLVREFLSLLDEKYLKKFDYYLNNGLFRFSINDPNESYFFKDGDDVIINCSLNNTITDPGTIIHEFFHATNRDKKEVGICRDVFSEFISIFMENEFYWYLVNERGYSNTVIYTNYLSRLSDLYIGSVIFADFARSISLFNKFGPINKYSFKKIQESIPGFFDTRDEFDEEIDNAFHYISKKEDTSDLVRARLLYTYIFGTGLVAHLQKINDKDLLKNVLKLNDNLNNINLYTAFKILGLDDKLDLNDLYKSIIYMADATFEGTRFTEKPKEYKKDK